MRDFKELIERLVEQEVDFVLVGGFAAVVHGVSLLTQDVDVCVSFREENMARLLRALSGCHPVHRQNGKPVTQSAQALSRFKNLYLLTDVGELDLLGEISGLGRFEDIEGHTIEIDLFGHSCRVLDIDALIRSKEEMDRPKDREAILQLKAIREKLSSKR